MGSIYLITNKINNKKYIGKTTNTINERWSEHKYAALNNLDNMYIHIAMRCYGIDQFSICEIEQCENSQLNEREQYYIEKYNTYHINKQGYNLTRGGDGYTRADVKQILSYWNEGKSAREISEILNCHIRTITDILKTSNITVEQILERGRAYGGTKRYKKIYQYDIHGNLIRIYNNLKEIKGTTSYRPNYISSVCNSTNKKAYGYIWTHEEQLI